MGSRKRTQRETREGAEVSAAPSEAPPYRELSLAEQVEALEQAISRCCSPGNAIYPHLAPRATPKETMMGSKNDRKDKARETEADDQDPYKVDPRLAAALAADMSPEAKLARARFRERFRELSGFDLDDLGKMDRCARTMGPG